MSSLFRRQSHKMVKHIQSIRRQETTNYLIVFDHFVPEKYLEGFEEFQRKRLQQTPTLINMQVQVYNFTKNKN